VRPVPRQSNVTAVGLIIVQWISSAAIAALGNSSARSPEARKRDGVLGLLGGLGLRGRSAGGKA
jgi:hypothetical protein